MVVIADLLARLGVDQREFEKGMKKSERLFDRTAKRMLKVGRALTIGITAPLTAIGALAIRAFAQFDQALTQSAAIMSDTAGRMGDLEEAARDVGRTTVFSATQAADAFFFLASAGLSVDESISALPQVAQFATAGIFDLATATDLATDAASALGLGVDELVRVSDVLVKANTKANASVRQFSEALTSGAAVAAKAAGVELEEVVALLAAFADQGIKSAEAGTKVNILLRDLTTKALKNADAFRKLNIQVFDANGNLNPLADIIEDIENAMDGMSVAMQKATLLQLGFTDKTILTVQAVIGLSEKIRQYEVDLQNAAGTTKEVSDRILSSFTNQWKLLTSEIDDVLITLGKAFVPFIQDVLMPVLTEITETVKVWVDGFLELSRGSQTLVIGAIALAAALGPLAIAVGLVASGVGALAGLLSVGLAPILVGGAIITGIAAVAVAFSDGSESLRSFKNSLQALKDFVDPTVAIVKAAEEATRGYKDLGEELKELIAIESDLTKALIGPPSQLADILNNELALELFLTRIRIEEITKALEEMVNISRRMGLSPTPQLEVEAIGVGQGGAFIETLTRAFADFGFQAVAAFDRTAEAAQGAFESMGRDAIKFFDQTDQRFVQFQESSNMIWDNFIVVGLSVFAQLTIAAVDFFGAFTAGLGNSLAQIIVFGEDAGEVFERFLKNLLAQTISTLVTIGAQWLAATILQSTLGVALHTQRVAQAAQLIFLNTAAGLAFLNPFGAGFVAAGITAATLTASKGFAAVGSAVGAGTAPLGLQGGGLITADGAAFLHRGEVVATPEEVKSALTGEGGNNNRPMDVKLFLDGRQIMRQLIRSFGSEIRMRGAI